MGKHRLRSKVKSVFGSHIDVDKEEELQGMNIETEDNYEKILALLQGDDEDAKNKIAALIMEFHRQYRSVYQRYNSITGKLRAKLCSKRQDNSSSSSTSDSYSYNSSTKKASNSRTSKLEEINNEKTGLMLEKETAMGTMEEEKRRNEELKMKLRVAEGENARLSKSIKAMTNGIAHKDEKIKELENALHVKEEGIVKIGEEKREAIRQLCMWLDYQRVRYEGLRQLLSNKVTGQRRPTAT